jgi:hypothetical protein
MPSSNSDDETTNGTKKLPRLQCPKQGFGGYNMTELSKQIEEVPHMSVPYLNEVWKEQMEVNNYEKYPQFRGNVRAVDIRSSWRPFAFEELSWKILHYGNNARVYMEVRFLQLCRFASSSGAHHAQPWSPLSGRE